VKKNKSKVHKRRAATASKMRAVAKFLTPITPTQMRRHRVGISNAAKRKKAGKGWQR